MGGLHSDYRDWHGGYLRRKYSDNSCSCRSCLLCGDIPYLLQEVQLHCPIANGDSISLLCGLHGCFFVALVVGKSFEMFASILGTWIPFALISTLSNGFICNETYVNCNHGLTRCKRLRCASPKFRFAGLLLHRRR